MQESIQKLVNSLPEFMWDNIFTVVNTLICGLIVAIFTSTFLKKKEERTRIAGVILEKRINSEQAVLHFLEHELFKEEINIKNSSKYDIAFSDLLKNYGLPDPYDGHIQYAKIFKNKKNFAEFFHEFEDQIMTHKLWLDTKVKTHLVFMQLYFSFFNTLPLMVKRVPLPEGKELTDKEFNKVSDELLLLFGASFDNEINGYMSELDEKIVDSVYKLELSRPKRSIMRDNMFNVDMKKCLKRFQKETILGRAQYNIFQLVIDVVYHKKGIDSSKMTDDEYDEFLKSSDPHDYDQIKKEFEEFRSSMERFASENGVKIVSKKDLDKYQEQYGSSLSDALREKEPQKTEDIKI